jgi:hypothetical protein
MAPIGPSSTCCLINYDEQMWDDHDEAVWLPYHDEKIPLMHDFVHIMHIFEKMLVYVGRILNDQVFPPGSDRPKRYAIILISAFPLNERGAWYLSLEDFLCTRKGIDLEAGLSEDEEDENRNVQLFFAYEARRMIAADAAPGTENVFARRRTVPSLMNLAPTRPAEAPEGGERSGRDGHLRLTDDTAERCFEADPSDTDACDARN